MLIAIYLCCIQAVVVAVVVVVAVEVAVVAGKQYTVAPL